MITMHVGQASPGKRILETFAKQLGVLMPTLAALVLIATTAQGFAQCIRCGPYVSVKPTSLTFKPQLIRTKSAAQFVTIANGIPTVTHLTIKMSGPFQSSGCPGILAPRKSCTLSVTFTPVALGTATGSIGITDGSPAGHFKVSLSGKGVASTAKNLETTQTDSASR